MVTLYNKAEVEKEAVNTEPVGDLLAFLSWAENTAGDCGIFGRENRVLCDAALCSAPACCWKACNDHTGKAQKQKPKVLYGSIGRLDVVLSVPIVPAHQTWTHKTMHHAVKTWCIVSMSGRFAIKTTYFYGNRWFFYAKKLGVPSDAIEFDPILTPIAFLKSSGNFEEMG